MELRPLGGRNSFLLRSATAGRLTVAAMTGARRLFLIAGIYGLAVILPQYFLEARVGRDYPPAITHPEYFYGFLGVAAAWQVAFLVIATDPRAVSTDDDSVGHWKSSVSPARWRCCIGRGECRTRWLGLRRSTWCLVCYSWWRTGDWADCA